MSVRVAIVGVGNCAAALVQGVEYYRDGAVTAGLMHPKIGPYAVRDVEFVAAFDVDSAKVGRDLGQALSCGHNCTQFYGEPRFHDVEVRRGPRLDGLGVNYDKAVVVTGQDPSRQDIVNALVGAEADVVLNHLPVGSERATHWWAETAIEAGCAFVNAIPVFLASSPLWEGRFRDAGLPILGDDLKSLFGATLLHRMLVRACAMRGIEISGTYQLNFGGNMDFLNMVGPDKSRLDTKKRSKTGAVLANAPINPDRIHVSPSDYVPWLCDEKVAYIRVEGLGFGGTKVSAEMRLQVADSPNGAGVALDAVRCAKLALDRGLTGAVLEPSAFLFKSPPQQWPDEVAARLMEKFIR